MYGHDSVFSYSLSSISEHEISSSVNDIRLVMQSDEMTIRNGDRSL